MTRLNTSGMRREWAPACRMDKVTLSLHGLGGITVRAEVADSFRALNACLVKHNYRTRRNDTGAFVCRAITGGTGYSPHAYGIAADLNWQSNPYGRRLITDMPAAMVADIKAIRTNGGEYVFRWGGDYTSVKDAMHWEVVCTRADLATGIDPRTVPGGKPAPSRPPTGDELTMADITAITKRLDAQESVLNAIALGVKLDQRSTQDRAEYVDLWATVMTLTEIVAAQSGKSAAEIGERIKHFKKSKA